MNRNKTIYLVTNGCPENRIDTARIQELLKRNNWTVTQSINQANLVLFNSCALTEENENCSMEMIKQIKSSKKPSARLIVCGCLPKINPERLREVYQDITFNSDEIEKITEIIKSKVNPELIQANLLIGCTKFLNKYQWAISNLKRKGILTALIKLIENFYNRYEQVIGIEGDDVFCIKVATGCVNNCSFCAVRHSRGQLKSKPIEKVFQEFEQGFSAGYSKFALIGTNVGAYGQDQGTNLIALLKELISKKGEYEIILRNIEPQFLIEMMPQLRNVFKSGRIPSVASAVESGNNRILKLMRRGYEIEDFKLAISTLKQEFPKMKFRTQVMVGFPSETEAEFQDTVKLLDELSFDYVEVYEFQPRPQTEAAKMAGHIPAKVAKRRHLRLLMKLAFNGHHNGARHRVLTA